MKTGMLRTGAWFCALAGSLFGQNSIWIGPAFNGSFNDPLNWVGAGVPVDGGTAVIQVGEPNLNEWIVLPTTFSLAQIRLEGGDSFQLRGAAGGSTLNLGTGGIVPESSSGSNMRLRIGTGVTLNLAGATTFDFGPNTGGSLVMSGVIAGTGPLTLANGAFLLNRTSGGNTYTGGTTIGTASSGVTTSSPTVTMWNNSPFGTGPVSIQNGAFLYGYAPSSPAGGSMVSNALTLNASGSATSGPVVFRAADTKLDLAGPVTLAGNVILQANMMPANYRADEGFLPQPGPFIRNPVVFSGNVGETGGARTVTFRGPSFFYLAGTNSWTGGTVIGQANTGSVVFASSGSIPATGQITLNAAGYAGVTDPANLATLVAKLAASPQGAIGLDTALGSPTVANFATGTIDLNSLFPGNPNIRLGTATQAIIGSGATIVNVGTNPYRFGNGGGTLSVQAPLTGSVGVALTNANTNSPLRLFLQGANTYTGNTTVDSGQLVLDTALPGTGQNIFVSGTGYVGVTENAGLTPNQFFARIQNSTAAGTVGFDTAPTGTDRTTPATTPRTVSDPVDLGTINGGFGSNVYLGTATSVILGGTITPSAVDNTYRLTAARGGRLEVASNLGPNAVLVGIPTFTDQSTNGTVVLSGTNTQTSTTLQGNFITLEAGPNGLGSGALNLAPAAGNASPVGLRAAQAGTTFTNPLVFQENTGTSSYAGTIALGGGNAFTLAGNISGPAPSTANNGFGGRIRIQDLANPSITFSGDNSAFHGYVEVFHGTLTLASANAAGNGRYAVGSANGSLNITQNNTLRFIDVAPDANLRLADGITVTVDTTDTDDDRSFDIDGTLGGISTFATTAALKVTGAVGQQTGVVFIANAAGYSGGTTIEAGGVVALGHNASLGSGAVTLNASEGGIVVAPGVTFSNSLTFTQGALAGGGTFQASNLTSYDFSHGRGVAPGFPGLADIVPSKLTLAGDAVFGDGGFLMWSLQEASMSNGASQLYVQGALSLVATSGLFTIELVSFNGDGDEAGEAMSFNSGVGYTWTLATAAGGITGFDPGRFTLDTSDFANGLAGGSFSVSQSGNDLLLHFTPVPEPSTYALLALGLGAVALAARRRRRA
jgi:autotransporter-associated beta strand protein